MTGLSNCQLRFQASLFGLWQIEQIGDANVNGVRVLARFDPLRIKRRIFKEIIGRVSEFGKTIFAADGPVRCKHPLNARADGPAYGSFGYGILTRLDYAPIPVAAGI